MKKYIVLITMVYCMFGCVAKQKPITYSVTVISAKIPTEKAPGITWDNPEKDKGFWAGLCKAAIVVGGVAATLGTGGTAAAAAAGAASTGAGAVLWQGCDKLVKKANPSVPLPDPFVEVTAEGTSYITPPIENTTIPIWNETFKIPYNNNLFFLIQMYDNDGDESEPIGSASLDPSKKKKKPFEVVCGDAVVQLLIMPIYETQKKEHK